MLSTLVRLVVLFALCAASSLALAQNDREAPSKAFADETNALRSHWQRAMPDSTATLQWIGPNRVLFKQQDAGSGWRFVVCNAATGSIEPAFDHAWAADQLTELLGRPVEASRLPLTRFASTEAESETGLVAMLDASAISHANAAIVSLDGAFSMPGNVPAAFRARVTSDGASGHGAATSIVIRNETDRAINLFWLDPDGHAKPYESIAARASMVRTTYAGHVWSIRAGDDELLRVVGEGLPTIAVVTEPDESKPVRTPESGPKPDGPWPRVLLRDHNIVLMSPEGESPLTTDGTWADGYTSPKLSPDGALVAAVRVARVTPRRVHIIESSPANSHHPVLHSYDYPKPGDPIARRTPWVIDIESGMGTAIDSPLLAEPATLDRLHWIDEHRFRLLSNERGHQVARLMEFDARTGESRTVVEETSETFIDFHNKIYHRRLNDGQVLWMSQRTGWNHLYLLDGDTGSVIRPLTQGNWLVRSVEEVNEAQGYVLLRVLGIHPNQDPYHTHLVRVAIDTGEMTVLTDGDGAHTIDRATGGAYYIARYSRVDLPPVTELRNWSTGERIAELARADNTLLLQRDWTVPERFVAKARDGETDIWGVIFYPSDFDPSLRYPVIENIYAGPHSHFVPKNWSVWHGHRELAERGFIVVQIDGMGTNWRSKAFHDVAYKNIADSGFPDRIAWLKAAAADRPFMDLSRVGIYGGSAGGQSSTRALLAHGDFYRAAVSDCGCHDNRVDKMWWNEQWMGYPIGPHYAEQSNVTNAHRLEGDLLLIVGELDRNVDPASTMQVVDALIKADKDFELLVIPGAGHGAAESPYGKRRRAEFFQRTLGEPLASGER